MSEKHTQTRAQRLAEIQEREWPAPSPKEREQTAAELRRLHEANKELLEALIQADSDFYLAGHAPDGLFRGALRAAIAKAEAQP